MMMILTNSFSAAFEATLDWIEIALAAAARRRMSRNARQRVTSEAYGTRICRSRGLSGSPETI